MNVIIKASGNAIVKINVTNEPMKQSHSLKLKSLPEIYEVLPEHERLIVDVLRQIIIQNLPVACKEKISYNVPFFYGRKGICIIWPSSIPRGGIKEGVLLGFWYGNKLKDIDNYLTHGNNKQIFYKIFYSVDEIDEKAIIKLLDEAINFDLKSTKIIFKSRSSEKW
jgi:hypothetical protein